MPRKKELKEPCMNVVYAYDTDIACGRPAGHSKRALPGSAGFAWDDYGGGRGSHCEKPLATDPPTKKVRWKKVPYSDGREQG